jgi:hypothetical protein
LFAALKNVRICYNDGRFSFFGIRREEGKAGRKQFSLAAVSLLDFCCVGLFRIPLPEEGVIFDTGYSFS